MTPNNAPLGSAPVSGDDVASPPEHGHGPDYEKGRAWGKRSLRILGISAGMIVLGFGCLFTETKVLFIGGLLGYALALLLAFVGFVIGIRALVLLARSRGPADGRLNAAVVFAVIGNGLLSIGGTSLTLMLAKGLAHGRQLRRSGRALLPPVGAGGAWASVPVQIDVDDGARAGLAAQWRENGRTEHASVAAFARLTLDLMALGAPPALVAAASRDAQDEVRHAELCFSLARALDGKSESPGPFPEASRARTLPGARSRALAALAVEALVDGALQEGVAARVIAKLARRCEEPAIRGVLEELAADEGRHAAHGWDVMEWCLAEGGSEVARALRGAVLALPYKMKSELPEAAEHGGWERYGIHGHALEAAQFAETRADLERRLGRMLGEAQAEAA